MKKSALRQTYLERRCTLSPDLQHRYSTNIADRLFESLDLSAVRSVHCFISVPERGEVSTAEIFRWLWDHRPNIVTLAPKVEDGSGELESVIYRADTQMEESRWKIPEPADGRIVDPGEIDVVIAPLVCFDRRGHRVGYGKGFYDRLMRKCRPDCIKAGLSFFPPVDSIDDVHDGDVRLDLCVTPDRTFTFTSH